MQEKRAASADVAVKFTLGNALMARFRLTAVLTVVVCSVIPTMEGLAQPPVKRPATAPAKTPVKPAPKAPTVPAPFVLGKGNLAATLTAQGYHPEARDAFQRLKVDETAYVYTIDLGFNRTGDWLVGMAHLAKIPDLTKVPSAPLLALLAQNDSLLGVSFSYNREEGQIMLNGALPVKGLTPAAVKAWIEGMKEVVRRTQPNWDTTQW